jgi:hypothetical protein
LELIKKTSVLWGLFLATVVISIGFILWIPDVGGAILDRLTTVDEVHSLLTEMSDAQKESHFMMTLMLDMIFPIAYGGLFAGLALRFGGNAGIWLAIPALAVIPVDLFENTIQLFALTGSEGLLSVKAILTPVKVILFNLAGLIALGALALGVLGMIRSRIGNKAGWF